MRLQESSIIFQHTRYRYYYLYQYLPLGIAIDPVSRSLLKFKRGRQPDLDDWIERARQALGPIDPTLPPDTIIIRALHHNETQPDPTQLAPLDLLGQTLSAHLQFPYKPGLLQKTRPTAINQSLTRSQRETELRGLYTINPSALQTIPENSAAATRHHPETTPSSILLLDDILTTGNTVLTILKTLHAAFPSCTVTIFTLAKSE